MDVNRTATATATAIATEPELNRVSGGELNGVVLSAATWIRETEKNTRRKSNLLKNDESEEKTAKRNWVTDEYCVSECFLFFTAFLMLVMSIARLSIIYDFLFT